MLLKPYKEPAALPLWRHLLVRQEVSAYSLQQYASLVKGHEGEERFALLLEDSAPGWLILHDLLLEHSGSLFQIDTLLISSKKILLFEVKNFEGDFYLDSGNWHTIQGKEIRDPLLQLTRCESLLRQYLQTHRLNIPIEAKLVFIHPEFTLYQAPLMLPLILPSQLNRLLAQLKSNPPENSSKSRHLAEKLLQDHVVESPYSRLPHYKFSSLKKGIACAACHSLTVQIANREMTVCSKCGLRERTADAIRRNALAFKQLFADEKITVKTIREWCGIVESERVIRNAIHPLFQQAGKGRSTHYIKKAD